MKKSLLFDTPCRILIADDEEMARKQIKRLLEKDLKEHQIEVQVETAETVDGAKQKLSDAGDRPYDVLLLDWRFNEGENGASLLEWRDAEGIAIDTEVIMLTSFQIQERQERALELGAYFYADKSTVLDPDAHAQPDGSGSFLSRRAFVFLVRNCMQRVRIRRQRGKVIDLIGQMHKNLRQVAESVDLDEHVKIVVQIPKQINSTIHKTTIRMPSRHAGHEVTLQRVARDPCGKCIAESSDHSENSPPVPANQGIVGHVYTTGKSYLCNKAIQEDPHFLRTCSHTKAELCVPLKVGYRVIGVLNLESDQENAFTEDDLRAMEMVAEVAAPSIRNASVLRMIMDIASEVVQTVAADGKDHTSERVAAFNSIRLEHVRPLFTLVLDGALRLTNATQGVIFKVDRQNELLQLADERGMGTQAKAAFRETAVDRPKGISRWVARTGDSKCTTGDRVADAELWDNYEPFLDDRVGAQPIKSFLCMPIKLGDEVFGVVDLEDTNPEKFTYLDEVAVEAFANIAASALANTALIESLKERQESDRLRARLQGRAELFALFAHDFKSPLNSIALAIGRCLQLHRKGKFKELQEKLQECQDKFKQAIDENDDLLITAKDAESVESYACVNLRPLIDGAWAELRPDWPDYQIEIDGEFAAGVVQVHGSPVTIRVIVKELIKNAAEAANGRGKIRISASMENPYVRLVFHDDGPGIRREDYERMFQMGFSTKGSSGQGLARARRIMLIQFGDLTVEAASTSGARFVLSLPIPPTGTYPNVQ